LVYSLRSWVKAMESRFYNVVVVYSSCGVAKKVLSELYRLGARGYKRFNIYIVSSISRPEYMECFREVIQNNVVYTLRVYYVGSKTSDLEALVSKLDPSSTTYIIEQGLLEYMGVLDNRGIGYKVV